MGTHSVIPKQLMKNLVDEHGKDVSRWPQELQDLIDPSIIAVNIAPPLTGKVDAFLNTDYQYYWAYDMCGATPNHDRVESMRWAGWEYATTDDVRMCSEATIKGRNPKRSSKDGGIGWSDEIRSGDRRLMKLPMRLYRAARKAQNTAAFQMAYPTPFGATGQPMSAANLVPGLRSEMLSDEEIEKTRRNANPSNSVVLNTKQENN